MTYRSVLMALVLMGCATTPSVTPNAPGVAAIPANEGAPQAEPGAVTWDDWSANAASVDASLERLAALDIVAFGALIVDAPAASGNCYGPCPEDPNDQVWLQEHARQAGRLAGLVAAAEEAAQAPELPYGTDVSASVEALNGLEIVEVTGVSMTTNCYGPCPEVLGQTAALAEAASGL